MPLADGKLQIIAEDVIIAPLLTRAQADSLLRAALYVWSRAGAADVPSWAALGQGIEALKNAVDALKELEAAS